MTTTEYAQAKIITELAKSATEVKKGDIGCIIPRYAFEEMKNFMRVKLPYRVTTIEASAFLDCSALE